MFFKISQLFNISQVDRNKFCSHIINASAPKADFYFLVILSTLIVSLGLWANNVILVIGGMMVAPMLSPILAIALGLVMNDRKVLLRSGRIFLTSFFFALSVSFLVGIFTHGHGGEIELIRYMQPSLFIFLIAIVAGLAASFTWAKPGLNENVPGIAVTVTLVPPLTATGLMLARGNWLIFRDTLSVFLLNVFGIILASLLVFSLMDFYRAKQRMIKEIKEEEKEIKKEKKLAETATVKAEEKVVKN
jgi:uncharacterized hydrophobic protein (TIGR00271 family)